MEAITTVPDRRLITNDERLSHPHEFIDFVLLQDSLDTVERGAKSGGLAPASHKILILNEYKPPKVVLAFKKVCTNVETYFCKFC